MSDTTSMKTPMKRVRGLGSAKSGTDHFWSQRLTAAATMILALALVALLVCAVGKDAVAARALLA
jgi:succinate dehydrogenase / fumarate reductase membrane anchor subunit